MTWPLAMVSVFAPWLTSRCQESLEGRTTAHSSHMARQHLAHVAVFDQILDIQQCGTRSRLQTHGRLHALDRVRSASSSASIVFYLGGHSVKTCLPASMAA